MSCLDILLRRRPGLAQNLHEKMRGSLLALLRGTTLYPPGMAKPLKADSL